MKPEEVRLQRAMEELAEAPYLDILRPDVTDAGRGVRAAIYMARQLATRDHLRYLQHPTATHLARVNAALDRFSEATEALGIRWWEVKP